MKEVLQKRLTFTPIVDGVDFKPVTICLLIVDVDLSFKVGKPVELKTANMRDWVKIKESASDICVFLDAEAKKYTLRNTSEIVIDGDNDKI